MIHRDTIYRLLVKHHVEHAVSSVVRLDEFLAFHLPGVSAHQCVVALSFREIESCCCTVRGTMTVGAGGVEVVLLDSVKHTDVDRSHIHLHRLCRIRDIDLAEGDDMSSQAIEDAETHEFDFTLETREFYCCLTVLDVAGRDDL